MNLALVRCLEYSPFYSAGSSAMNHAPDSLWVDVETWSPYRPQRILHGRISREDYLALRDGPMPFEVRLGNCRSRHCPAIPVQDMFLRGTHILNVTPSEWVA